MNDNNQTIGGLNQGDKCEAKRLRTLYNLMLDEKDRFVEKIKSERLTPEQLAQVDIELVRLTGDIKRIDSGIQQMVWGDSGEVEFRPMTIVEIVQAQEGKMVAWLRSVLVEKNEIIRTLKRGRID